MVIIWQGEGCVCSVTDFEEKVVSAKVADFLIDSAILSFPEPVRWNE
jgi:hypothetical protein